MKELLYYFVGLVAKIHDHLLGINDAYASRFTDKELHFLVIGVIGMLLIFGVYPVFKWLAKHNHIMVVSFIYVFTLIIVVTFAIEIGQGYTHTGNMEFADIVFGIGGYISMFFVFAILREFYHVIKNVLKKWDEKIEGNNKNP